MARGPKLLDKWVSAIRGAEIPERLDQTERTQILDRNPERFTDSQRELLFQAATGNTAQQTPQMSIEELTRRRMRHGGHAHQENDRIIRMTPQVSRAIEIIIASIISPNDLRKDRIRFSNDETSLNDDERAKLEKMASEFFEERFSLSTVISKWIDVALYRTGAKILLTIPSGALEQEMLSKENFSMESFHQSMVKASTESVFGFGDAPLSDADLLSVSQESFKDAASAARDHFDGSAANSSVFENMGSKYQEAVKHFLSAESFSIVDNPGTLRNVARQARVSKSKIARDMERYRKGRAKRGSDQESAKLFVQLAHSDRDKEGEPLFLDANAESCIPLYVPGSPANHIGYLFTIDEHGNIARMDPNGPGNESGYGFEESDKMDFGPIYGAFGFNNASSRQSAVSSTISAIYSRIVECYLSQKVQNAGMSGVTLGSNPAIYRYMFSQYMSRRQVRLIFVPADMVTYFTYEYDEQGCGVSKLEDIKFPLSLRTAAAVARAMNFVTSAMPLRQIELTTNNSNHAYQLQTLSKIQAADIQKRTYSLTSNPDNAIGQMAERAYTFKINGGAGFEWNINNAPMERGNAQIDEEFMREVSNEIILGMGAPPATMNALNEGEYSRSVATTNLVFASTIAELQKTTVHFVSRFCQTYANFSEFFRGEIAKIIESEKDNDSTADESGTLSPGQGTHNDTDTRIDDIIASFKIVLPSPRVAPDTAQYEHAERITQWISQTVDAVWPDSLAGDDPAMKAALDTRKVMTKLHAIRHHLGEIGMADLDFLNLDYVPRTSIIEERQRLRNLAAAMTTHDAALGDSNNPDPAQDRDGFGSFDAASRAGEDGDLGDALNPS